MKKQEGQFWKMQEITSYPRSHEIQASWQEEAHLLNALGKSCPSSNLPGGGRDGRETAVTRALGLEAAQAGSSGLRDVARMGSEEERLDRESQAAVGGLSHPPPRL